MRARHRLSQAAAPPRIRFEDGAGVDGAPPRLAGQRRPRRPRRSRRCSTTLGAVDALVVRRDALEAPDRRSSCPPRRGRATVARLRCLRGIDTLSAVGLCAEIGDFDRFARAGQLMSYLGLVPSEDSTGEQRRQGAITKTGSGHARRLLVEAAWHYRRPHRPRPALKPPPDGQPAHAIALAGGAQQRLHRTLAAPRAERGKRSTIIAVAVARELAGFCWAIATADRPPSAHVGWCRAVARTTVHIRGKESRAPDLAPAPNNLAALALARPSAATSR